MRIFLFLFLFLNNCNARSLNSLQEITRLSTVYQYKGQESKLYAAYYYWYKFPSVTLCGFYILNKQTKKIDFHLSDYKTCEYEIEDGFSIETAKLVDNFKKSFHHEISLGKKDFFPKIVNVSLKKETPCMVFDMIKDKINITFLEVVNVKSDDKLNVRKYPNYKSQILLRLPNKSLKLFMLKKDIDNRINISWVKVHYFDEESYTYKTGWVNKKYLLSLDTWKEYKTKDITIYYPVFLTLENNSELHLFKKTQFIHKQYKDGRDGVVEMNEIYDFNMIIKVYDSFQKALKENYLLGGYDFNKSSYSADEPVQKMQNGYSIRTGSEGIGDIYFIQHKHNKTLVGILKYNKNHILPLQKTIPFLINYKESIELAKQIIFKTIVK